MKKASRRSDWNIPTYIIVAYLASGFMALFVLPDGITEFGEWRIKTGLFGAVSILAEDYQRVSFFCTWMVVSFFPTLLFFSIFAPVRLKRDAKASTHTYMVLIIGFVLFGVISSTYLVHYIAIGTVSDHPASRLDRLASDMAQDNYSLFFGAGTLLSVTMMTIWLSFVAIPVAFYKLIKFSKNTHH